jgi:hypothetical protein
VTYRTIAIITVSFAVGPVAFAQPGQIPPVFQDAAQLVTTYHHKPDPARAAAVFDKLIADKALDHPFMRDEHRFTLNAQAFGHMARSHADLIRKYEAAFPTTDDAGRRFILGALTICGDDKSKELVAR